MALHLPLAIGLLRHYVRCMRFILTCFVILGLSQAAHAAVDVKAHLADIVRVESYLSNLTTLKADFSQVAPSGDVSEGTFFLKRPGKMRWQYKPPTPILLVSDGDTVTYFDAELDQVNFISLDDTLAGFLAQKTMKLNGEATELMAFEAKNGAIRVTLQQRGKPEQGSLTLEFSDRPLLLRQMVVTDSAGNSTRVAFQGAQYGAKLPDSLFVFEDPRGVTPRKRN